MDRKLSRLWLGSIAAVTFLVAGNIGYALRILRLSRFFGDEVRLAIRDTLQVLLCVGGAMTTYRVGLSAALREVGLRAPFRRALMLAAVASLPMLVCFGFQFPLNSRMTFLTVVVGCFVAPFAEEVLFRGYIFRQLYRRAGLPFGVAVLLPSLLFALGTSIKPPVPESSSGSSA